VDLVDTLARSLEQRVRAAPEGAHNQKADRLSRRDLRRAQTGPDSGTESTTGGIQWRRPQLPCSAPGPLAITCDTIAWSAGGRTIFEPSLKNENVFVVRLPFPTTRALRCALLTGSVGLKEGARATLLHGAVLEQRAT